MKNYKALSLAKFILTYCHQNNQYINKFQLYGIMYLIQKEFIKIGEIAFDEEIEAHPVGPFIPAVEKNFYMYAANPIFEDYPEITIMEKGIKGEGLVREIIQKACALEYFTFQKVIKSTAWQLARSTKNPPFQIYNWMIRNELKKECFIFGV